MDDNVSAVKRWAKQMVVYWPPSRSSDASGRPIYQDPVEFKGRWEDTEEEILGPGGRQLEVKSRVLVTQDVEKTGVLWLGTLETLQSSEPFLNEGAAEIKHISKIPDRSGKKFIRWAFL